MENFPKQILSHISNLVLVLDNSQNIIFANTAFGIFYQQRSSDFIGKSFPQVLEAPEDQKEQLLNEILEFYEVETPTPSQRTRSQNVNGCEARDPLDSKVSHSAEFGSPSVISLKDRFFSYEIFEFKEPVKKTTCIGIIFNDLTEEKQFLDCMTEAENISNLKTLVAGIAHEICNPLYSILGFAEGLQNTLDTDKTREYANKIADNSQRLGKIISKFSDYVHSNGDGVQQDIDLNQSVETAIQYALLPYPDNQIELDIRLSSLPNFKGSPEEIQHIFVNIINNAIQAMELKGRLGVSTRETNDSFVIEVQDNGPGIPPEILRKMFNPFFTTKKQGKGTGLGLSITQKLLEKNGGKLKIDSEKGKGTRVYIYFEKQNYRS